ncbi:MAG: MFS transporter, partial [Tepidiformaceae bacterium]
MASIRPLMARQFSSLTIHNYRVYFFGQMISLVGTWMQTTGQAWLVLKITGSPFALGAVTTLQFLPITLFTLFGGVFADRLPKRRMLIITQAFAMAQAFILGILVVSGRVELWHIYVLALSLGTVNAFDGPVRQSFVVELVGREQLVNAVALNSSIFNVARIIGPAVAGLTIALFGLSLAFFFNAASFVAVLIAYTLMRPAEFAAVPKRQATGGVFSQVAEGIKYS